MRRFCEKNQAALLQKPLALFLSCLNPKEFAQSMEGAYPLALREHAFAFELTGGEYIVERMNFIERFLIKRIVHVTSSQSHIDEFSIQRLIYVIQAIEENKH